MKTKARGAILEAVCGDISDCDVDAVVNAANNHFWMGGGVAGALRRKGGASIETDAMAQGPRPVGECVLTSGGLLKAKKVLHAAVMGQDLQTDAGKIRRATRSALQLAEEHGLKSIAFPALGTGVGGFPVDQAARVMTYEVVKFLSTPRKISRIVFVLYDDDAFKAYEKELKNIK